jgi:hypothetical protein
LAHSVGVKCSEDFADCDADGFGRARGGLPQQVLELGEDLFDWVQVRRVFRQEEELGPGCPDELAHRFGFVTTEIVHDHGVAGAKRGDEDLLDIDREALTVDWTVEYRAMIHEVFAPGMHSRAYYHRYTDDNVDLCDVLSSFSYGAKVKLDELSRIMGLAHSPIATSSCATVERASLTSTWLRRFIVLTTRLSARCSGVSNAGAPVL